MKERGSSLSATDIKKPIVKSSLRVQDVVSRRAGNKEDFTLTYGSDVEGI